jgi:SAM-dependent methyltransferase
MTMQGSDMRATPAAVRPREDACPLCGGRRLRPMPREAASLNWPPDWHLARCAACGLIFRHPMPDAQAIAAMYEEEYWAPFDTHAGGKDALPPHLRDRLDRIDALMPRRGRLLEVGPGFGRFLVEARQRGWEVQGVEVSHWAGEQLRQQFGLPIVTGTPEEAAFPAASFDVAYMNHVLEHLPDPIGTLSELRRILKPDGLLVVEVPQEFTSLFDPIWAARERLRGRTYRILATDAPEPHLFFYRPSTLRAMLARSGFARAEVRSYRAKPYLFPVRLPGGTALLRSIFAAEHLLDRSPLIEAYARV